MPSPFPGMDPYLEDAGVWPAFHSRIVNALCEALYDVLPPGYDAELDERVRLVAPNGPAIQRLPDVGVTRGPDAPASGPSASAVALEEVAFAAPDEERTLYVRVLYGPERDLVTAIELLSPANKTGDGLIEYEAKRNELLAGRVNLVEINLLVGGERPRIASPWPTGEYYALVLRAGRPVKAGVRRWRLSDPLPAIPVPLRAPDADVSIDLAPVFATAYERGRYARRINYANPVPAPLGAKNRAWAERIARAVAK